MGLGLAIAGMAVGVASSATQMGMGIKRSKDARKRIDELEEQEPDLSNPYKNLSAPTKGAELQMENLSRNLATMTEQAGDMGFKGTALAPQMAAYESDEYGKVAAQLEELKAKYDQMRAAGDVDLQNREVGLWSAKMQGAGNELNTGQQNIFGGATGLINTLGAGTVYAQGGMFDGLKKNKNDLGFGDFSSWLSNTGYINDTPKQFIAKTPTINSPSFDDFRGIFASDFDRKEIAW